MIETILLLKPINVDVFKRQCRFHPVIITRQHIGGKNVGVPVVVDIAKISSHRRKACMLHALLQFIFKGSVLLIYIQIVSFKIIIRYIYIGITVVVHITYRNTQSKTDKTSMNASLFCDIGKMTIVIS